MRKLALGQPPTNASLEDRVKWIERAIQKISQASHDIDVFDIADKFVITNLTEDRTIDVNSTSLAELADIVGTLISDMKKRGAKRV